MADTEKEYTDEEVVAMRAAAETEDVPFLDPRAGEITRAAFNYAQGLILMFDSFKHAEFERERERLMKELEMFSIEFLQVTHLYEKSLAEIKRLKEKCGEPIE